MEFLGRCCRRLLGIAAGMRHTLAARLWSPPAVTHAMGTGADLLRGRAQLLAENARLRQQLIVLRRSVKRPAMTPTDRALLVLLAGRTRAWRRALLLVQPETLLRWHRAGFRALWRKSRPGPGRPPLAAETVALIRQMAAKNPRWGVERVRGELGKLGIRVAKRTIPTYLRGTPPPRPGGRPGRPSCATMRPRPGPATSCRLRTPSSDRYSPSSSSSWPRGGSSTSA